MKHAYRTALAAFLLALVGGSALAPTTTAAAAESTQATPAPVVCTTTNGCGPPQDYPVECDDLTAQDQTDWDNYWYNGVPLPHPELGGLYAQCFGF